MPRSLLPRVAAGAQLAIGLLLLLTCRPDAGGGLAPDTAEPRVPSANELAELAAASFRLEFVSDYNIPAGTTLPSGEIVGGLSGLFLDPATHAILAISDDDRDPRYFVFEIDMDDAGMTLQPTRAVRLGPAPSGQPRLFDAEAILLASADTVLVSTEGRGDAQPRYPPVLAAYSREGTWLRQLPVPSRFLPETEGPQTRGVRHNLGFESLTLAPDGSRLFVATESALVQDGPPASFEAGTSVRIVVYEPSPPGFEPMQELVYRVEPTPAVEFDVEFSVNGLVDMLALTATELLALERSYTQERVGPGQIPRGSYAIRVFRVSAAAADDVSEIETLAAADPTPVTKQLLLDVATVVPAFHPDFRTLDNFEGLALGPILDDGSPSLLILSDDNFNPRERTAFLLFRIVNAE